MVLLVDGTFHGNTIEELLKENGILYERISEGNFNGITKEGISKIRETNPTKYSVLICHIGWVCNWDKDKDKLDILFSSNLFNLLKIDCCIAISADGEYLDSVSSFFPYRYLHSVAIEEIKSIIQEL